MTGPRTVTPPAADLPGTRNPDALRRALFLGAAADEDAVADQLAEGRLIGYGFANFYALSARPEPDAVRAANRTKGRPPDQVGSLVTTPLRIPDAFDWSRLPRELNRSAVLGLMDALFARGPFGFRGPAADTVPPQLSQESSGIRTTQVIAPGYRCPSNAFIGRCLRRIGRDFLYITSANRSHHLSGAVDEPAHHRADALAADFGTGTCLPLLRHRNEERVRRSYPWHAPVSTTLLAFHCTAGRDREGRIRLVLERHGSLGVEQVQRTVDPLGFSVVLGPAAGARLLQRHYPDPDPGLGRADDLPL